jgi:hypothetical protein
MDRDVLRQYLAQAERHIALGKLHLARQRAMIAELVRCGHETEEALAILSTLQETQALHLQDRERLVSLTAQHEHRTAPDRVIIYRSIRQEDAQRSARLREMEKRAAELLRDPTPDTFLGRERNAFIALPSSKRK